MNVFETASVRVLEEKEGFRFRCSDSQILDQITTDVKVKSQATCEKFDIDDSVREFLILSGFENRSRLLYWAEHIINMLERNHWLHDNHLDLLYPECSHFKKPVENR